MIDDKTLVSAKLLRWENYLSAFHIPSWAEIPDIGLYMEQVLLILSQYLDYLPPELREEEFLTAATIHNYVRRKIIPEPAGKKYYRRHLAYLIMICTMKQSLSITTIQRMLPVTLSDEEIREIYISYAKRHEIAKNYFIDQVKIAVSGIIHQTDSTEIDAETPTALMIAPEVRDLISQSAVLAGFSKLLAEKLLLLEKQ